MLAIPNSACTGPTPNCLQGGYSRIYGLILAGLILITAGFTSGKPPLTDPALRKRVEEAYLAAKATFERSPTNSEAAWHFGRASFDWADFAEDNNARQVIANRGIEGCERLIERDPKSAPGHYYLGLNLGQLARTKSFGALKIVRRMEDELSIAATLDPHFDHAGPDRSLGILYSEAPGWPASIGNHEKARVHLERAVELDSEFPDNQLSLLEAELKWGERKKVIDALPAFDALLKKARKSLAGDGWTISWIDWEQRRAALSQKLDMANPKQ